MVPDVHARTEPDAARTHRARLQAAIAGCAQRFAETRDLYDIIKSAVTIIRDEIGLDRVGIYLYDEEAACFTGAYGTDVNGSLRDERQLDMARDPRHPIRRALAGEGDEFFIADFERAFPGDSFMRGVKNHFFIVLRAGERILGAISVDNLLSGRPITARTREDLRRFARYIALAIENFQLRERVEEKNRALTRELERRNRLLAELDRANEELKDFAYIVAHDLKAPLRGISSLARWLSEDYREVLEPAGRDKLDRMVGRTRRMYELIDGILRYSAASTGELWIERLDAGRVLRRVLEGLAVPRDVRVHVRGPLPEVWYDPTQLEQVFQNLVGNAVHHMGSARGDIEVGARPRDLDWEFYVRDHGPGIPAEAMARIFQPFQTGRSPDEPASSGVGLAIVKKIVERHGGRVSVESAVGEGSTFSFTVPRRNHEDPGAKRTS